jgi:SRSO17 transposase
MVNEDMGDPNGVMIFDETGFLKKGNDSVGVAKQYCGSIGKVDNCQVGVFVAYASPHGYALLNKRLFIPEKWFSQEYAGWPLRCSGNFKIKKPSLLNTLWLTPFTAIVLNLSMPWRAV